MLGRWSSARHSQYRDEKLSIKKSHQIALVAFDVQANGPD
jgi:hypothetical protein